MGLNRTAKGIVLVPSLLLGGAFLAAAAWGDGAAAENRPLAIGLGAVLMAAGLLAQLLPERRPDVDTKVPGHRDAPGDINVPGDTNVPGDWGNPRSPG